MMSAALKKRIEENLASLPARREQERHDNAAAIAARLREIASFLESEAGQTMIVEKGHERSGMRRYVITEMLHDQQDDKGNASYAIAASIQTFIGQVESRASDDVILDRLEKASPVSGAIKLRKSKRVRAAD
jgi:hypothetical protein